MASKISRALYAITPRMMQRSRAIKRLFGMQDDGNLSPDGKIFLIDLNRFCFGADSTHTPNDPFTTARNEGRREVLNRILLHLKMDFTRVAELKQEEGDHYDDQ